MIFSLLNGGLHEKSLPPFLLACAGASSSKVTLDSMTDPRDGQTYKTVKIGSQTWMAQNLNYEMGNSYCFGDDSTNCAKYGRFYRWDASNTACPEGWYLPSKAEWDTLIAAVGGNRTAGAVLKSSSGWADCGDGLDAVSFSALPAVVRDKDDVQVLPADVKNDDWGRNIVSNDVTYFWSFTEIDRNRAYRVKLGFGVDYASLRDSTAQPSRK